MPDAQDLPDYIRDRTASASNVTTQVLATLGLVALALVSLSVTDVLRDDLARPTEVRLSPGLMKLLMCEELPRPAVVPPAG